MKTEWTPERVEKLKELFKFRMTARNIAHALGGFEDSPNEGRSAVIGKIDRLGLNKTDITRPLLRYGRAEKSVMPRIERPPNPDQPAPNERKITTLISLEQHHCRYPIGDLRTPEFYFCAADREVGIPYCQFHMGIAYQSRVSQMPLRR